MFQGNFNHVGAEFTVYFKIYERKLQFFSDRMGVGAIIGAWQ